MLVENTRTPCLPIGYILYVVVKVGNKRFLRLIVLE